MNMKKATIKDVAKMAEVSIGVVSFVLNETPGQTIPESTKKRVLDAVKKLNYTPNAIAKGMRTKKARAIGLVSFWDITMHVFNEILEGVYKVAEQHEYTIVISSLKSTKHPYCYSELFKKGLIDGILLISANEWIEGYAEEDHIKKIKEYRIPAVIIHGHTADESLSYTNADYYNSTYMATEYLASLGHRKLGFILPEKSEAARVVEERLKGFTEAVEKLRMAPPVCFRLGEAERIIAMIAKGEGPTGVVAYKAEYAHGFYRYLNEARVMIPRQVSIIAANNPPFAEYLFPSLTTIRIPFAEMGEKGCNILIRELQSRSVPERLMIPNELCLRESCMRVDEN